MFPLVRLVSDVCVTQGSSASARNLSKVQSVHFPIVICLSCRARPSHKREPLKFPQQPAMHWSRTESQRLRRGEETSPGNSATVALRLPFISFFLIKDVN